MRPLLDLGEKASEPPNPFAEETRPQVNGAAAGAAATIGALMAQRDELLGRVRALQQELDRPRAFNSAIGSLLSFSAPAPDLAPLHREIDVLKEELALKIRGACALPSSDVCVCVYSDARDAQYMQKTNSCTCGYSKHHKTRNRAARSSKRTCFKKKKRWKKLPLSATRWHRRKRSRQTL